MRKVLVVEDQQSVSALVGHHLEAAGMEAVHAATVDEAWRKIRAEGADLAVVDLRFPDGVSGWQLIESLRATPAFAALPVIVLTGMIDSATIDRAGELRCDYMNKPFTAKDLMRRVERLLDRPAGPGMEKADASTESRPGDLLAALPIEGTIHEALGIRVVEAAPDRVVLEMEVGPSVHQPMGLLHGGASAVIAESAASFGSVLNCGPGEQAVGIELNISHLRARSSGMVRAVARPVRKGRRLHVWAIEIVDEDGQAVAVARCTVAIRATETGG